MRVKRFCTHLTTFPHRYLCRKCLIHLKGSLCAACEGYVKPLPPCACQRVYQVSEARITAPCQYCGVASEIWDLRQVKAGRWGKVPQHIRMEGEVEVVRLVTIPFLRTIEVCLSCFENYQVLVALTPTGQTAFLPQEG